MDSRNAGISSDAFAGVGSGKDATDARGYSSGAESENGTTAEAAQAVTDLGMLQDVSVARLKLAEQAHGAGYQQHVYDTAPEGQHDASQATQNQAEAGQGARYAVDGATLRLQS